MKILGSYQKNIIRKIQTLIDIAPHEWFRVWYLFLITFFFMVGHVFGHAIILASVTTTMGIYALPYFLIIAAVFAMVGTTVFARIIAKYDKPKLFVGLSLAAVVTLVAAYIVGDSHLYLFYSLVLLVVSVFQVQLHTILALMKEHKFSPLESQRTFPVIESSELLAGIVGGGVISLFIGHGFFAHYIHLSVNDFLLFWAGALLLAVITHYVFLFFEKRQPVLVAAHEENENLMHFTDSLQQAYKYFSENKFLRNIAFFVFLQFAVFQAFEFLYTFYLSSHDDSHGESILHGLGYYVFITSIIGIFLQVFVSSFISKKLGVVKNLLLHPFLTLPVGFLMQFQFSQGSVIGAKGMFDVTKQIAKNAYMSSLYAIPDNIRQLAKPFLDGFVAQLGIIFSTGFLILFELFLHDHVTLAASIFINILLFTMIIVLFYFREIYTGQVTMNLKNFSYSEEERFSFIEILGQKWHKEPSHILGQQLIRNPGSLLGKKILQTMNVLADMDSISYLLDYLENIIDDPNKKEEKKLAVSALNRMIEKNTDKAFTRYRSIELLKKLFVQENSKSIKIEIIRYFASIGEVSLVPFLLDTLGTEDEEMLADSIATIGTFKDPNIYPYLKKFLTHKNPYILANTMIALWSFKSYRLRLMGHAVRLAMSKDVDTKKAFIYMIGETQGHQEKEKMYQYLEDEDQEIRKQASIALAKLWEQESLDTLLEFLLHEDRLVSLHTKKMTSVIQHSIVEDLNRLLQHKVLHKVLEILSQYDHQISQVEDDQLHKLHHLFTLIDKIEEVEKIEKELEKRSVK